VDDEPVAQVEVHKNAKGKLLVKDIIYLVADHLNTPRFGTDANAQVVWRWEGDAFGDTKTDNDPDDDGKNVTVNLRFPGQYFDAETGLHYNWHRYYDPKTGRYISSDPIGLIAGLNTYAYVANNPLMRTDRMGLDFWMEGSVPTEGGHPFHQSVCVGQWDGPRGCISFGVAEDNCLMSCKGEVYQDTSAPGSIVSGSHRTTNADIDAEIAKYLGSLIGKPGTYYLIGNNCRDFSRRIHRELDRRYFHKGNPFGDSFLWR
jgi:RHS repeat-associated protein